MTGGGILALVAYGAQNVILSGNPQMSYFYKTFKRYTHFAMENITVPLEGPNELKWDQPIQLRAKIPRYGDLLSDLYFSFDLPAIYSKYIAPDTIPGRTSQWEFEWVRYVGAAILQNAAFFIGGQKIQEFDGTYLLTRALLDMDQDAFLKWSALVGDVPEMTNPAAGAYAGGTSQTAYPTVVKDTTTTAAQANRPSIQGRTIHVPLSFWFAESPGLSVPLVGLQSQECEIQITLNPCQNLYTILDNSGYRTNPTVRMIGSPSQAALNLPEYAAYQYPDLSGNIRNFLTDYGVTQATDPFFINPRLQGTFVYLPDEERKVFATRPLTYLVSRVQPYSFPIIQRQVLELQTHNPVTRLIFVQQRSDAAARNDFSNYTNWVNPAKAPYQVTPGANPALQAIASGLVVPATQEDIIRGIRILCNGNEIQEEKPVDFFTRLSTYRYLKGIGKTGLPIYSFQLGQNSTQPSGSINTSRIRLFEVDLDVYPLPVATTYTYDVTIYVESLCWLEIVSGMGGLKFAL